MATSDGSSMAPTINHVEPGTKPTAAPDQSSQKEKSQEETMAAPEAKSAPPTPTTQPEQDDNVKKTEDNVVQEAEDLVVVVEEKGVLQSSSSSDSRSENQEGMFPRETTADVTMPSGVSTVSMPVPHVLTDPDVGLHRSRSETDASLPSVDVASPSTEEMSNLQEFLSSPHGNNQIVERSPGGRYVRFMEKLGSGASKDVYRAYDTEEGIEVAWNVVHLAGVPKNERNRIVNEVRLLERLHHQNIISFHGSWVNRERQQVNFVTEILSSGTLKSFINKVQVIRWKIAKRWAVQILKGLEYLHAQDPPVIHRDLKCENIFINGTSGDLRIGDLGLSTVHRNGRVLSVLGTPEFMAPDMYEEGSYDEKVDIYAFGMCLLEIFTKEIPYRECNNPAQIYKKVMRGAPPDSLARLKSTHAREFIELCMGYKNDDGSFVRPSATELLAHPFLIKRANDDDEVEVEPALQDQPIREGSTSLEYASEVNAAKAKPAPNGSKEGSPKLRASTRSDSLEEEESDRFEEMPDSEVNSIRKVKVLMGRGEELKEADDAPVQKSTAAGTAEGTTSAEIASASSQQNLQLNEPEANKLHYLVAAAVIEENEQTQYQQPYPDDILKLVVTLPVEGQTQNVQFDFHLVEDDSIQVAKEMIAELGIPQGAVLEISETISSLARAARTKKHKYDASQAQRAANQQGHVRSQSHSIGSTPSTMSQQPPPPPPQQQQQPQNQNGMQQQQQQPPQHIGQHSAPEYIAPPPPQQQQHLQQMPQGQDQNYQQQMQPQQGMPYQDQSGRLHPQHIGQNQPMSTQAQQIPQQSVAAVGGETESRPPAQAQYGQHGVQSHPQSQPSYPAQQQQHQGTMNGEFHHHAAGEQKIHQAPGYNHMQQPPNMPPRSISNANAPPQVVPHQQGTHNSNHGNVDSQAQTSGASYPPAQGHMQHGQAPAPGGPGNGAQHVGGNFQPGQHDGSQAQYHYAQQQNPAAHSQAMQPSGPPHHIPQAQQQQQQLHQQQQFQGVPQNVGQGYGQNMHQQSFPSSQGQHQHQQHSMPQGQGQNVVQQMSQQSMQPRQNVPQHQPPIQQAQGMPQAQSMNNQMHQQHQPHVAQLQQQQPGIGQQRQQTMSQATPVQQQQQPQHQQQPQQLPGQPVVTAASASNLHQHRSDPSSGGDYARSAHSSPATTVHKREGSSGTVDQSTEIQRDSMSDLSVGALGGLPMDLSSDDEVVDVDDPTVQELRQLDEEMKKNLMRAKKVFVNRMDNLQRTQVQREAQHKKTLEQHQKDRAAFEKRLHQEEIEQNRRIEHMQKEWDRRREEVRLKQADEKSLSSTPPTGPSDGILTMSEGRGTAPTSTSSALSGNEPPMPER
ncbi:MAG: hypothetical protein SGILL_000821 [Bacillariaceae sp.]